MVGDQETPVPVPPEAVAGVERNSREEVIKAFDDGFDLMEADSSVDEWTKKSIKEARGKTIGQNKSTFTNTFENHHTGESFNQEEGIPVEDLLDFLNKKITDFEPNSPEWQNLVKIRDTIYKNSEPFLLLPHRMEPDRFEGRVHQEAYLISRPEDGRKTGSERDDYFKALDTLNRRHELILPAQKQTDTATATAEPEIDQWGESGKPAGEEPILEEPSPDEVVTTTSVEEIRREVAIVNRSLDIRKRAGELAEIQLRDEMRRGSAWNPLNWPRKIGLRIMEEFHRQRYIDRATRAMLDNNNSYLNMDVVRNAAVNATNKLAEEREAGKATVERIKEGGVISGEQVVEAQGALKEMILNQIIRPAVEGGITDYAQVQQKLREFVENNQNDPQVQAVFGRDATQYGKLAEYFASDILETAEVIKQDIAAHKYAIEQLNDHVSIKLANASWAAETQAQFNMVDRAVAWAERHRVTGVLINPATIGAAFSIGVYGLMRVVGIGGRAAQIAVPGAGLLPGALFAAARRNYDLKVDRAAHQVEMAYNAQIPAGAKRREAMEKFAYDTVSVGDLLNNLSEARRTNDENEVARRVAEIKTRLDFSATQHIDLITFTSRESVEQGRLALIKAMIEARLKFGPEFVDLENNFTSVWSQQFTKNREQQDRSFRNYRIRNAIGAGAFGAVAGLAGGFVSHEVLAGIGHFFEAPKPPVVLPSVPDIDTIKSMFPGINAVVEPNGHISVTGGIPPDAQAEMQRLGFTINQGPDIAGATQSIIEQRPVSGSDGEWLKNSINIDHREWYSYNQSGSQLNELRLYTFKEGDTVILDLSKMGEGFQRGLNPNPINVQDVIKNGEAGVFISRPDDPQNGFWIMDKDDGVIDGHIRLDPNASGKVGEVAKMVLNQHALQQLPDGNIATELRGHQDVFNIGANGKPGFIEAGRIVERNGVNVLQDFATIRGTSPIPETIEMPIIVPGEPTPTFDIVPPPIVEEAPTPEQTPFIIPIPFAPRHPLEPLVIPRPEYPYYNFGYELFRRPDGRPATLSDIVRFRSPDVARDRRIAQLFPPRSPQVGTGTSGEVVVPEATPSVEGEQALAVIRETFLNSPHIYISFSGAIGDVAINSAYIEGIRQYTQNLGQAKKVTLIVPPNIVPLIEPLSKKLGYEIVTEERYKGIEKARSLIEQSGEANSLVLEFEHNTGRPVVDFLPNNGLVVGDLFAASVGMYDNGRSGSERFSDFFSDLLSIPSAQRVSIHPRIDLPENSEQIFSALKQKYSIDTDKQQIAVIIEASHQMKRYSLDNWRAIIQQIAQSQQNTEFNVIFNPMGGSYSVDQLQNIFGGIPGARLVSGNLTEQMVLLAHQNLVLSNDTGLAHIGAVLENGPNVISLHVPPFPPNAWVTNQKRHHGIMAPFTEEFRSEEADESKKLINKILPQDVVAKAMEFLVVQPAPAVGIETVESGIRVELPQQIRETFGRFNEQTSRNELIAQGPFATGQGGVFGWQQVSFGEPLPVVNEGRNLYRGYLMIEPQDMPRAIKILERVAKARLAQNKPTDFKWLMMKVPPSNSLGEAQAKMNDPANVGKYENLGPADPRIALYGENAQDIQEILTALATDREWMIIESNRRNMQGGAFVVPPRRPGTNAFVDNRNEEWRSLNYNNYAGFSEDLAQYENWRDMVVGDRTVKNPIPQPDLGDVLQPAP